MTRSRRPTERLPLFLLFPLLFTFTLLCSAKAINTEPRTPPLIPAENVPDTDVSTTPTPSQQQLDYFISGPALTLELYGFSPKIDSPKHDPGLIYLVLSHLLTEEARGTRDSIKEIEVRGWERGSVWWGVLAQLVESIPEITDLRWSAEGFVSKQVLAALESCHPSARLHVSSGGGGYVPRCSPNLHSVSVRAGYGCTPGRHAQDVVPATLRLLQTCPSPKDLDLTMEWCGCVLTPSDHYAFDLSDRRMWKASLERLTLFGYRFDEDPRPRTYRYGVPWTWRGLGVLVRNGVEDVKSGVEWVGRAVRGRDAAGIEGHRVTNLDAWMDVMDWSRLRHLSIQNSPVSQLPKLAGRLGTLESFELGRRLYGMRYDTHVEERAAVLEFLGSVKALRELGLSGMGGSMPMGEILKRHGASLESLKLHEKETHYDPTACATRERDTLSTGELEGIREACPKLQKLEVDADRNGSWPGDILCTLATFPALSHLTLNLQLGIRNETYTLPRLDNSTALSMFQSIRSQKLGTPLQSLALVLGEWGEHMGGGLRYPGWEEDRRGFYVCELQEGRESCWVGGGDLCFDGQNAKMWPCDEGGKYKWTDGGVKDEL